MSQSVYDREGIFHNKQVQKAVETKGIDELVALGFGTIYGLGLSTHTFDFVDVPGEFVRRLIDVRGKKILEIGCGIGVDAEYFAKAGAKQVKAVDLSESCLEVAKKRLKPYKNTVLLLSPFEELKLPQDETFDLIFARGALHHLKLDISMQKIRDHLKSGGKAVLIEPSSDNPFINLYRKLTPTKRTEDEAPLSNKVIRDLSRYGLTVSVYPFILIGLPIVLLMRGLRACYNKRVPSSIVLLLKFLFKLSEYIDKALFFIPFMKQWAWIKVIILAKK